MIYNYKMWLCQWQMPYQYQTNDLSVIKVSPNISISNLYFATLIHCWRTSAEAPTDSIAVFNFSEFTEGTISIRVGQLKLYDKEILWYSAQAFLHVGVFILGN